jgi:hypothetical protein
LRHRVHGGGVPVRQRALDLHGAVRVHQDLAGQHGPYRGDGLRRQVRQVGQGLFADFAALPVRTAQQVPLVGPLGAILQGLVATGCLHMHRV